MQAVTETEAFLSPSFNTYTNTHLAQIASRVVIEEQEESNPIDDEFHFCTEQQNPTTNQNSEHEDSDFAFVSEFSDLPSPIDNGQIRPVYPLFNRDLLNSDSPEAPKIRLPLRKLFLEERETALTTSSSSSSESDELDGVPVDMYCVWRPNKAAEVEVGEGQKSNFNSKRWRLKELLLPRSHSDGSIKDSLVIFNLGSSGRRKGEIDEDKGNDTTAFGRTGGVGEEKKRFSYLPYKRDLLGFFW